MKTVMEEKMSAELDALVAVKTELKKLSQKYKLKAEKERTKVNDVYVLIKGEKCYTEAEINSFIEADCITADQSDRYIEKLRARQEKAGQNGLLTKSERICNLMEGIILNFATEIEELSYKEDQERKRQERWQIAKAQGCTYMEWLNQEEVSRQSEEYEKKESYLHDYREK